MSFEKYDTISPLDFRYGDQETIAFLSESAFTQYKLEVELALVRILVRRGVCPPVVLSDVEFAVVQVTTDEVYKEEGRIKHDIRALVNCIRQHAPPAARPFIHMTATSYDIIDTANAMRFRDVVHRVFIPALHKLEGTLIEIVLREAETVQVGRTHGQHAVPITFGFALAEYVNRLGECIERLGICADELPGKFSGACGAYNASTLFFDDPEEFERAILGELGLHPAKHSTQIVPPEPLAQLLSEVMLVGGVMANLATDMRQLQRTEIAEVGEEFESDQVGSSTMPQKRNPINFENVVSMWKILVGRMVTMYLDQVSEHQRDLTNSASLRTAPEMVAYAIEMAKRLARTMTKLSVDQGNLGKNFDMSEGGISAEPLYIVLAALGHPDAHEKVRTLTLCAQREGCSLQNVMANDPEMDEYVRRMTPRQLNAVTVPRTYTGIAARKAKAVAEYWKEKLEL